MPVTIREVAQRLHLSITTVSRALDGYSDVAEATRELVVRTAHQMGYAPNQAARQLRRQRSESLGYILPASEPQFADPFFSQFISGLGDEAARRSYDLLISSAPPAAEAEASLYQRWCQARRVDGFILNRIRLRDWRVHYLTQQGVPFVSLERPSGKSAFPSIEVDGCGGFMALMAHLTGLGHQRIAYVGGRADYKIQADRFAGYQAGLVAANVAFDPALIAADELNRAGGYRAAQHLLSLPRPPSAITCVNDLMAIGVLQAARERGLIAGSDLAVAGFDGIEETEHTLPPLTTLKQPVYDIARRLVSMLLALIRGETLADRHVRLQPELIIRASTQPAA